MDSATRRSLAVLCVPAVAAVAYPFVPLTDSTSWVYYDVVALGAMLLALWGVAHHRPVRRRGWLWVIAGFSGWVAGDLMTTIEQDVWHLASYPVPSDAIYLGTYVVLAAGVLLMVRTRRAGRDVTALLDAAIIATGAAVVAGVFLIAPLARSSDLTVFGKVVSSAYPMGDVLLIAVIVRMWAAPGARTASYLLLVSGLGLRLAADAMWSVSQLNGALDNPWSDQAYLVSYVLIGAAACVPSMRTLAEPAPDRAPTGSSQSRLIALAVGLTLPADALLLAGARGGSVLCPVIGLGSLVISGLVLARMSGILRTVEVQAVQLAALARSDALTGAPNRRTWDHELSRACAASREQGVSLCVAMMDIDHFKAYNDTFGHQAGDLLLCEAVAAWTERLGAGALLARYGGEEFTVLLPGLTVAEAQTRIQALAALTPNGQTFSAGVSAWDPATEPADAVARADQALYEAKSSGRDRVLVYGASLPAVQPTPLLLPRARIPVPIEPPQDAFALGARRPPVDTRVASGTDT